MRPYADRGAGGRVLRVGLTRVAGEDVVSADVHESNAGTPRHGSGQDSRALPVHPKGEVLVLLCRVDGGVRGRVDHHIRMSRIEGGRDRLRRSDVDLGKVHPEDFVPSLRDDLHEVMAEHPVRTDDKPARGESRVAHRAGFASLSGRHQASWTLYQATVSAKPCSNGT